MARSSNARINETSEPGSGAAVPNRPSAPQESRTDRIARRAYERFQARGGEHGHDQEDWFAAEAELREDGDAGADQIAGDVDARRLEESARRIGGSGGGRRQRPDE